ncbi:TetR/AcrR family transcriptional regulator [Dietzia lutea]|uniref:HTH tetR-type domain-containing protein n=1 Tax=Dietzia lutea TaxID=546160 RepID=A0A2S1RAY7_9ACTN|nr:TetR/AcrR family transcriptional regulator [Dietzia lutea]AWH93381.1 hypothetical protein A6035_15665 [Dietzia lutea]
MPRPVDPEHHRARRLHIIDAGLTILARHGYAGATTAAICREASIGSGTFFHYFPTKDSLVVAIIEEGAGETQEFFDAQDGRSDASEVVFDWVRRSLADLADPRAAGFIGAVSGLVGRDDIAAALAEEDRIVRAGLTRWLAAAQHTGSVRTDVSAARLARWVMLMVDGFAGQVGAPTGFDAAAEQPLLFEAVGSLLAGPGGRSAGIPAPSEAK